MNLTVPLAMFGWLPAVLLFFVLFPGRRAVLVSFIAGWLFLPMYEYDIPAFPDYSKTFAICLGIIVGSFLLDPDTPLQSLRLCKLDIPIIIVCFSPFFTAIANELGAYEGLSASLSQLVLWGIPYIIGRAYFKDRESLRDLAVAIVIGGLVYTPFCLFEIRMSPRLHRIVYGFHQHLFSQTRRLGGWRPMVFMQHGLAVGMWMATAALLAIMLLKTNHRLRIFGLSTGPLALGLTAMVMLCKSLGAMFLFVVGLSTLFFGAAFKSRLFLIVIIVTAPIYLTARIGFRWAGDELVAAAGMLSERHASSIGLRMQQEEMLTERALEQPILGWGRFGRHRIHDEFGRDISVTDSLWINSFGPSGIIGLIAIFSLFLLPVIRTMWMIPPDRWITPEQAPSVCMAIVLALYAVDCLLNQMPNPFYPLIAGALFSLHREDTDDIAEKPRHAYRYNTCVHGRKKRYSR